MYKNNHSKTNNKETLNMTRKLCNIPTSTSIPTYICNISTCLTVEYNMPTAEKVPLLAV